ncbi:MAG: T9SS type A sorting domain-containing protein, partial [Cytophagales bacterium]|nr:T9SS type A sorting domain-containing protein [Cytophagales bacterium]
VLSDFLVQNDSIIVLKIPRSALAGPIGVENPAGTTFSTRILNLPIPARPEIKGVNPVCGDPSLNVSITGKGFITTKNVVVDNQILGVYSGNYPVWIVSDSLIILYYDAYPTTLTSNSIIVNTYTASDTTKFKINLKSLWQSKASWPVSNQKVQASFVLGNKMYVLYYNNTSNLLLWEWDQSTNVWTQKTTCPIRQSSLSSFVTSSVTAMVGFGSVVNGSGTGNFYEYNQTTDSWTAKNNFPFKKYFAGRSFFAGGKNYMLFGSVSNIIDTLSDKLWEYNQINDSWISKAPFPDGGKSKAYVLGIGDKGYVSAGPTSFWEYNTKTDTWKKLPNFPGITTDNIAFFSVGSRIYAGGGYNSSIGYSKNIYEYDIINEKWKLYGTVPLDFSTIGEVNPICNTINNTAYIGFANNRYYLGTYYSNLFEFVPFKCDKYEVPNLFVVQPQCSNSTVDITNSFDDIASATGIISYWTDDRATIPLTSPTQINTSGTYYIKKTSSLSGYSDIKPINVTISNNCTVTEINETLNNTSISIYPVPTTGILEVSISKRFEEPVKLQVKNSQGISVFEKVYEGQNGIYETLDLSRNNAGLYIMTLASSNDIYVKKLVIVK